MLDQYLLSFWGTLFIIATMMVQTLVATGAHRKQSQYVPGGDDYCLLA